MNPAWAKFATLLLFATEMIFEVFIVKSELNEVLLRGCVAVL
jgi:hypothetical protein